MRRHIFFFVLAFLVFGFALLFVVRTAAHGQAVEHPPTPQTQGYGAMYQMGQMAQNQEQMTILMNGLMQNMGTLRGANPPCSREKLAQQDAMLREMRTRMQQQANWRHEIFCSWPYKLSRKIHDLLRNHTATVWL